MMKIVAATKNRNKIREFKEILEGFPISILSLEDMGLDIDVVEDKDTFEGNAEKKAMEVMKATGLPSLADDSGLEVFALDGAPGVNSARFSGIHGDDKSNNIKLLKLLEDVPYEKRGAKFVAVIVLVYPDGSKFTARGEVEGIIAREEKGDKGFGYDPLFIIPQYDKTFAELGSEAKNKISHRGKALEELKNILKYKL
ncbi:Non-canonical purine NTP pyrophosphatase [Oxobacter pfennigii]|uniref:dITP/XTP pyrophosphatase n=1 Tax=Oxobacter pfennigii TaxID=36849 RepID=A0A0P8YFV4_9CLOT|nr:XTP/dITP diphosphatase [Oxobacter pfennigii]KPU45949.1 Non-canonical purine NTP pyrophosphatase [Oxobacter pfennigii]